MQFFENEALESQRDMKQEQSGCELGTGPANKKQGVMSLPPTAPAAMVDVAEQDVMVCSLRGGWECQCL